MLYDWDQSIYLAVFSNIETEKPKCMCMYKESVPKYLTICTNDRDWNTCNPMNMSVNKTEPENLIEKA